MAIYFFDFNRKGGGSGGIMTLDNGLNVNVPGNGQLGGPLLHPTLITLNAQTLEILGVNNITTFAPNDTTINSTDGTNQSQIQTTAATIDLTSVVLATSVGASIFLIPGQVQINAHDSAGTQFSQITVNQLSADIIASDPAVGRGESIISAGDVKLDVQDIPGIQNSFVDVQQNKVTAKSTDTTVGNATLFIHPDESNIIVVDNAANQSELDIVAVNTTLASINPAADQALISTDVSASPAVNFNVTRASDSHVKQLQIILASAAGIEVIDNIDNIGLQGNVLFPLNGNPDQYLQAGHAAAINASNDVINAAASLPANVSFVVPAGNGMFLCNAYTFWRSGVGSVAITVTYTDVLGASVTAALGSVTCSAANPHTANSPIYIKAQAGTTVAINWVLTGVMTFDAGGAIQFFGA